MDGKDVNRDGNIEEQIRQLAQEASPWVIKIRRDIHAHPELSMEEERTGALVAEELRNLGLDVTIGWVNTGVVGILKGAHPGKTVMLRADMDALPIQEAADLPYASKNKGVMHACAHDGHTAALLGVARVLSSLKDSIYGTVKFFFQPSEAIYNAARDAVRQGVLKNPDVDYALGMHLWGPLEKGKIAVRKGPMMASPCIFKFQVIGKGGHGAMPQNAIDPIAMTVCAINDINYAISRRLSPYEHSVISFGSIHGGTAYNIIPEYVEVVGTVRAFDQAQIDMISGLMEKVLAGVTESWGGSYTFDFDSENPPVINDDETTEKVRRAAEKIAGKEMVCELANPDMGAEDFSFYGREVPASFFFVGIADDVENPPVHHNDNFAWDDNVLQNAVEVMSMAALEVLAPTD